MLAGILICAANLWAEPANYLASEGSSYGLSISKEAKLEALGAQQTRAGRLLLYQDEIDTLSADVIEAEAAGGAGSGGSADAILPDGIAGGGAQEDPGDGGMEGVFDPFAGDEDPHDTDTGTCGKLGCSGGDTGKSR